MIAGGPERVPHPTVDVAVPAWAADFGVLSALKYVAVASASPLPGAGTGLIGLTDRVEALGGTITVHSPPGEGTTLQVWLPVSATAEPT